MKLLNKNSIVTWYLIRLSALALIPGFLFDLEIIILVQSFNLLHIKYGLESIIIDYVHNYNTQVLYLIFLRLSILKILFYAIELIL